ncbi:hypothetical protein [Microbulbifer celer]|uniref:Uncharacterized protein n=1 Tax=Microbulbifer celer TaxID=435905 RepID=A0ABW3U3N3_9GAMM|nr:hypothetical protein [Microbulbifer celer]UFN56134.1 hypothetical protein LPW13_11165 [Microbulbifer celer]
MGFQIRFDHSARIVRATFFGQVELEDKLNAAQQVAEKYGHLQPLPLLVDVREAEILLTLEERKAFGQFAARLPGLRHARTAVLHAPEINANVVINDWARNEGMLLGEFITEHMALSWLAADVVT